MKITRRVVLDYLLITLGTAVTAVGLNGFYVPNRISDGGVSGLGIILLYLLHIPVWVTLTAVNLPLLWLSHKLWGGRVGSRTVYGALSLSVMVAVIHVRPLTHSLLLATVYGGILSGSGLGLVFRSRGTTGGTDVLARFVSHILPISMGQGMLVIDFFVISAFGLVFNPTIALYALIALFISTRAIDVVQEGTDFARAFTVVSSQPEAIADHIVKEMDRGVTRIMGKGHYTGTDRTILYVVVLRSEVTRLKDLIYSFDPQAFVVVGNVHDVLGEGFRRPPLEE